MKIQNIPVHCKPCGHDFTGEIVVEAPVAVAVASMKAMRCPACGQGPRGLLLIDSSRAAP